MKTAKGKEKGKDGKGDKNAKNADKEKQRKFIVRRVQQIFRLQSILCLQLVLDLLCANAFWLYEK